MKRHIGIYDADMRWRGGSEKRALVMADALSRRYRVTLIVRHPVDVAGLERYFGVDLSRVHLLVTGESRLSVRPRRFARTARALATSRREYRAIRALRLDLFINNTGRSEMLCPAPRGVFMCMFPHRPRAPLAVVGAALDAASARAWGCHPRAFLSYAVVTANSEYTADWVGRYWGVPAQVVYSVCDPVGPGGDKEKVILSVGRFNCPSKNLHPKNQGVMIEAFKRMGDLHRDGWVLHLAGSVLETHPATAEYVAALESSAAGYPIIFHRNAPLPELRALYRRAAIYWHAAGYGYGPQDDPGMQEHFGITTVEALSAGCVPVVINTGGQRETVRHGVTGLRWDDLDGLADATRQLATDPDRRRAMSEAAAASVALFSREAFTARIESIVARLLG